MLTSWFQYRRPKQLSATVREAVGPNMTALIAILGIAGTVMLIPVVHWLIKGD